MREPIGNTLGSAATVLCAGVVPDAVMRPVQYAVAVNERAAELPGAVGPFG